MHKSSAEVFLCCGIDVSAAQLVVAFEGEGGRWLQRSFPNRASGHQALIRWLQKNGTPVRACLEATGLYSLDLALALHAASGIEVAVLYPQRGDSLPPPPRPCQNPPPPPPRPGPETRRLPLPSRPPPPPAPLALP